LADVEEAATVTSIGERAGSRLGSRNVARTVYGAIIGLALVVALQAHPPGAGKTASLLVGTAVTVALAELYSDALGAEVRRGRRATRPERREMAAAAVAVGIGAGFPAVFFVLAAVGLWSADTAFNVAKWSGLGLIFFYGFLASRLGGEPLPQALLRGATAGLIGGILIGLKALLH
jgi:VIT1/CCC1 family predicted Fe2+/Mn2+ transporter